MPSPGASRARSRWSRPIPSTPCAPTAPGCCAARRSKSRCLPDGSLRTARPDGTLLRSRVGPGPARRGVGAVVLACAPVSGCAGSANRPWASTGAAPRSPCGTPTRVVRGARGRARSISASRSWSRPMPTGTSSCFYENSTRATFDFGEPAGTRGDEAGTATVRFAGGVLRRYLIAGTRAPSRRPLHRAHGTPRPGPALGAGLSPESLGIQERSPTCVPSPTASRSSASPSARSTSTSTTCAASGSSRSIPTSSPISVAWHDGGGRHRGARGDDRRRGGEDRPRLRRVPRRPRPAPLLHRRPRASGRRHRLARAQRLPRLHRPRHPVVVGGEVPHAHRRRCGGDLARHERAHVDRVAR